MNKMPALFVSHGAPNMLLHGGATHDFLKDMGKTLARPRAILAVSAHWETEEPMLTAHPRPGTIHDFYGFEPELYEMTYNAPGAPELAEKVGAAIPLAALDPERGLDHGAWSPLKIAYPEAEIPVFQLSVQPHKDAAWHYRIGEMIAPLSEQGVLIVGSGNTTHNLRAAMRGNGGDLEKPLAFSRWLHDVLSVGNHAEAKDWEKAAPHALWNHPTPEHFLPLFTALGAGGGNAKAQRVHEGIELGVLAMDAYKFS